MISSAKSDLAFLSPFYLTSGFVLLKNTLEHTDKKAFIIEVYIKSVVAFHETFSFWDNLKIFLCFYLKKSKDNYIHV